MSQGTKLFVAVKAIIVNERREVLLLREASTYLDGTNVGRYDLPGGRIDTSEALEEALAREVMEETGLRVTTSELIDVHDTFNEKGGEVWHIVRLFYRVSCSEGEVILSKDHDAYQWLPLGDIDDKQGTVIQNLVPILQKVRQNKGPRVRGPEQIT